MDEFNRMKVVLILTQDKYNAISDKTEEMYQNDCKLNKIVSSLYMLENVKGTKISDFLDGFLPEMQKLEKLLETGESKKSMLSSHSQENQQQLEEMEAELNDQDSRVLRMIDHINASIALHRKYQEIRDEARLQHSKKVQIHNNWVKKVEDKLHMSYGIIHETRAVLNRIQDKLAVVYEKLEQAEMFYQMMGDHVKGSYKSGYDSAMNFEYSDDDDDDKELVDTLKESLKSAFAIKNVFKGGNEIENMPYSTGAHNRLLEGYLSKATEKPLKINCQKTRNVGDQLHSAMDELLELSGKLQSLSSTKFEQVVTIYAIANVIQISIGDLEHEYVKEVPIVKEIFVKIRSELYALKEDAATFPTLGAMFATQCKTYIAELNKKLACIQKWEEGMYPEKISRNGKIP